MKQKIRKYWPILVPIIIFLVFGFFTIKNFPAKDISPEAEILEKDYNQVFTVNDLNSNSFWHGNTLKNKKNLSLSWTDQKIITGLRIDFGKTREAAGLVVDFGKTREVSDFNIKINNSYIISEKNNQKTTVFYKLPDLQTDKIELEFNQTSSKDGIVRVNEIFVYGSSNVFYSIAQNYLYYLRNFSDLFYLFFICFGIFILIFIPGYAVSCLLLKNANFSIKVSLSFLFSIFLFTLTAFLALILKLDYYLWFMVAIIEIFSLFLLFRKKEDLAEIIKNRNYFYFFFFALLFCIVYQFTVEHFCDFLGWNADYLIPFGVAQVFINHINPISKEAVAMSWGLRAMDRMPLLALLSVPFLKFFGSKIIVFQAIALISTLIFIFPLKEILDKFFNNFWQKVVILVIILNPYFLHFTVDQPNRFFAIYFLLIFYLAIFGWPKSISIKYHPFLAGLAAGLAFLIHFYVNPFIIVGFIYLFWQAIIKKNKWLDLFKCFLVFAIIASPWLAWIIILKAKPVHLGWVGPVIWKNIAGKDVPVISSYFDSEFIYYKLRTTGSMLVLNNQWLKVTNFLDFYTYKNTLSGALVFLWIPFVALGLLRIWRYYKKEIIIFGFLPLLIIIVSYSSRLNFDQAVQMQPLVLMALVIGVLGLQGLRNKKLIFGILMLYLLVSILIIWFLQWQQLKIPLEIYFLPAILFYLAVFLILVKKFFFSSDYNELKNE